MHWHQIFNYTESPLHLHKQNKVYVTRERHNKITTGRSESETPYSSIPGVLRDPQCEVRHRISPSVSSKNKVLTAEESSQMAGLPFFPFFLSFNNEKL